jgi:hypothetical protein
MALADGILHADALSKASKTQYLEKLGTLTRLLGNKPLQYVVDEPARVFAAVERKYPSPLTQRAFVAAAKALFHYNEDLKVSRADQYQQYTEIQNRLSQIVSDRYMSAEPSERERVNWVPWPEVMAKERELAAREYGSDAHLLLAMYCLIEPLRQDFGALLIVLDRMPPDDAPGNFLVVARDAAWGKLVLNEYKTFKKYGRYVRDLPADLLAVIRASLLCHPRRYLFVDRAGRPYELANSFTRHSNRVLKKLFGKSFSVSLMRHSHISDTDFNASTPRDLIEKSKNMAHSITMQQLYRRKVDPEAPLVVCKVPASGATVTTAPAPQAASAVTYAADGQRYLTFSL